MDVNQIVDHLSTLSLLLRLTFILIARVVVTVVRRHRQNRILLQNDSVMEEGENVLVAIYFMKLDVE